MALGLLLEHPDPDILIAIAGVGFSAIRLSSTGADSPNNIPADVARLDVQVAPVDARPKLSADEAADIAASLAPERKSPEIDRSTYLVTDAAGS